MEEKFSCRFCEEDYDLQERIPRILKQCGHCICAKCLRHFLSKAIDLVCPIDNTKIVVKGLTLDDFPKNASLIHIISIKME